MYLHCVYVGVRYPRFWTPLALPALKLVRPHFRPGAVIVADNTAMASDRYQELFAHVDAEGSGFRRVTMPL
ncbi:hypothetical protein PDIDSM_8550 [Penicillium digitatum]|nr:hypothetical protein PDIDSM_8550 [Penicillium digitatum]